MVLKDFEDEIEEEYKPRTKKEEKRIKERDHQTQIHWKIQSELFGIENFDLLQEAINKSQKEIHLARMCLEFKGFKCNNRDCKNYFCPLNPFFKNEKK